MKVFGVPVKVEASFWALAIFLGLSRLTQPKLLAIWVGVIFFSVLVHELGHALVGRRFGLKPEIKFFWLGALTTWKKAGTMSPKEHIAICLAGPAAGFLLGGAVFLCGQWWPGLTASPLGLELYYDLLQINWLWGLVNLLPIQPLDGWQALRSLEELVSKRKDAPLALLSSFIFTAGLSLCSVLGLVVLIWSAWTDTELIGATGYGSPISWAAAGALMLWYVYFSWHPLQRMLQAIRALR